MTRPVYRHAELDRVLNPRHVCIVGASPKPGSFGERVLTNLGGFGGNIYLVNSKYDRIGDRRCYPSMASLPENPQSLIAELDINPIICAGSTMLAVDALIVRSGAQIHGNA